MCITIHDDSVVKVWVFYKEVFINTSSLIWFLIKQEARFGFYRRKYLAFYIGYLKLSLRATATVAPAIASSIYAAASAPLRTMRSGNCGAICLRTLARREWIGFRAQDVHGCRDAPGGPSVVIRPNDDVDEGGRRCVQSGFPRSAFACNLSRLNEDKNRENRPRILGQRSENDRLACKPICFLSVYVAKNCTVFQQFLHSTNNIKIV